MSAGTIRVWDAPTRVFHWLLAICVMILLVTGKLGGEWMEWHKKAGYVALGLVLFRLAWGVAGSETARFAQFLRGPRDITDYVKGRWKPAPGHNPLGALNVIAMLVAVLFQAVTGLFTNDDIAFEGPLYVMVSKETSDTLTQLHQWSGDLIIGLVALHVLAIVWYLAIRRDNLIGPMFTGRKAVGGAAEPRFASGWIALAWAIVAAAVVWAVVTRIWA